MNPANELSRNVILTETITFCRHPEGSPATRRIPQSFDDVRGDPSVAYRLSHDDGEKRDVLQRWNFPKVLSCAKVLLCITLLLMVFVVNANVNAQKSKSGLAPGTTAPPLALPDLNGKVVHLNEYRGKVVVLNFFAFWCDTWKDEWPHLLQLAKLRKPEKFAIVCASVDGARQQQFRQLTGGDAPFPVLMDSRGYASKTFHITHVPTVMVLDKKGVVRYACSGYPGDKAVLDAVRKAQ